MLSILIADDHPIVRSGLKLIIRESLPEAMLFEARNGAELIKQVTDQNPDIVIMDLNMPNTDPQRVMENMLLIKPGLGIIILSMNKEEIYGNMYLNMGAMAYLQKGCETSHIIKAIETVADGNLYITKEMHHLYRAKKTGIYSNSPFAALSKKEMEVLRHIAKGESGTAISKTMNLSTSTVGTHKAKIFTKLNISGIFELKEILDVYPLE